MRHVCGILLDYVSAMGNGPPNSWRLQMSKRSRLRLPSGAEGWLLGLWRRLPSSLQGRIEWLLLPKFLVGAVAVVLDDSGGVLLFRHTYRLDYPWGLPGGWIKASEQPTDAVEREVLEESGLLIKALHPLVVGGDRDLRRLDLIFLCQLVGGTFRPSAEVSDAGFFELRALPGCVEPFHVQVATYATKVLAGEVQGYPRRSDT
jgi:ADP-ribose pyrophosphatase YjhB (NUDIX family)